MRATNRVTARCTVCSTSSPCLWSVSPKSGKPNNPIFYDYFCRKLGEGKTKSQALVCIMRRLVNIVYGQNELNCISVYTPQ